MFKGKYLLISQDFMDEYSAKLKTIPENFDIKTIDVLGAKIEIPDVLGTVTDDTAEINITGPMTNSDPSPIDRLFGYNPVTYSDIQDAFMTANEMLSETVGDTGGTITVNIDTPGGEVNGVDDTHAVISAIAENREIIFVNRGTMTSGGEWLASAGTKIVASSAVSTFGSIGVVLNVADYSEAYKRAGIEIHTITNDDSSDKIPDVSTENGRAIIKQHMNEIFEVFADRMTAKGNITKEQIKGLAGRVVLAGNAIKLGLAEEILTNKSSVINGASNNKPVANAGEINKESTMDLTEFINQNPGAKSELEAIKAESFKAGAEKEKSESDTRIESASKFMCSDAYSAEITALAVRAAKGEISCDALEVGVTIMDAQKEKKASISAQDEGEKTPETPSIESVIKPDAKKDEQSKIDADFAAINALG